MCVPDVIFSLLIIITIKTILMTEGWIYFGLGRDNVRVKWEEQNEEGQSIV